MTDIELTDDSDILDEGIIDDEPEDDLTEEELRERESDPALCRHSGICRACKEHKGDLSNDSGYCMDCD